MGTHRQVRIRVDKEGNWFLNEVLITNENVRTYLTRHLCYDERGGYFVRVGDKVASAEVEDTPVVVTHCHTLKTVPALVKVVLSDRTEEVIPWRWIWTPEGRHVYCFVKGRRFKARFNRNSQFELGQVLEFDEKQGGLFLKTPGGNCYLAQKETCDFW